MPTTEGAYQRHFNGAADAFVAKLIPDGGVLVYSTYLGGGEGNPAHAFTVDTAGHAYVAGHTASADFPTTEGALARTLHPTIAGACNPSYQAGDDAFVSKLTPDGSRLAYSTFLGGSCLEHPNALAVDNVGSIYVAGHTASADFPTKEGVLDRTYRGGWDTFVTKLSPFSGPTLALSVSQAVVRRSSETLVLTATTAPGGPDMRADVYVAVDPPNSPRLYLRTDGSLTASPEAFATNWAVAAASGPIYVHRFTGAEPLGRYTWQGVLTEPGTGTVLCPVGVVSFWLVP